MAITDFLTFCSIIVFCVVTNSTETVHYPTSSSCRAAGNRRLPRREVRRHRQHHCLKGSPHHQTGNLQEMHHLRICNRQKVNIDFLPE